MLRTALRELRHHPGRYLATLIAIAISVGFMAAASVSTSTESRAMGHQAGLPYTRADYVVTVLSTPEDATSDQVAGWLASAPGVTAAWPLSLGVTLLESGETTSWARFLTVPPDALSWTTVGAPARPLSALALKDDEVVLSAGAARHLNAQPGSTVSVPAGMSPSAQAAVPLRVVGITNEPITLYDQDTAYLSAGGLARLGWNTWPAGEYLVTVDPGAAVTAGGLIGALTVHGLGSSDPITVETGADRVAKASQDMTQGIDAVKYLLWVFAGIALVVGMITIANTFAILLAQRRRQLGLLRAVGASGAQTRRSVWIEALAIGLAGSLLGVGLALGLAAIVGAFTGSVHLGLVWPWRDLGLAVALGTGITVLAASLPARRATRIPVLEALRPAEADVVSGRRTSAVRAAICGLLVAVGLVGCVVSLVVGGKNTLVIAIGGAALLSAGVLFGAPLFVPGMLRGVGALVGRAGVVGATAAKNVARDPARSSATATALMLAVGLIVTLQVGASTVQTTITGKIATTYPIDLWVQTMDPGTGIPPETQSQLAHIAGVVGSVTLECRTVADGDPMYPGVHQACAYDPAIATVAATAEATLPDGQVLVAPEMGPLDDGKYPASWTLAGLGPDGLAVPATVTLSTVTSNLLRDMSGVVLVSPAVFARLDAPGSPASQAVMFLKVDDAVATMRGVSDLIGPESPLWFGGAAPEREMVEQTMSVMVAVVTALLAVAVLIALVGVGNTLTLSVVERTRESALLRALGLRRGQLRAMLLVEALLLTVASAVVGVAFGAFFGFVGAHAVAGQVTADADVTLPLRYSVNWWQTAALLGVLVLAAALASVIPGRRAASVSPVEALAEV